MERFQRLPQILEQRFEMGRSIFPVTFCYRGRQIGLAREVKASLIPCYWRNRLADALFLLVEPVVLCRGKDSSKADRCRVASR